MTCGAQPNTRVKLAAPRIRGSGCRRQRRCDTITVVNTSGSRRSLRAIR